MSSSRKCHVSVNLIRKDQCSVIMAYFSDFFELIQTPDSASGVMRVTKDKDLTTLDVISEFVKIYLNFSVCELQRGKNYFPVIFLRNQKEWVVNRRQYHNHFALICECLKCKSQPLDNTRGECQHLCIHMPSKTHIQPVNNRTAPVIRDTRISENAVITTFPDSIDNIGRSSEIHIGYPHWNEILSSPSLFQCL